MKLSRIACSERPFHRIFFRLNLRKLSGIIAAQLINMNVKRGTFELLHVLYIAQEPGPLSAALRLSPPCASHCTSCTDCHPPRKTTSLLPILESSVSPLSLHTAISYRTFASASSNDSASFGDPTSGSYPLHGRPLTVVSKRVQSERVHTT